MAGKDEAVTADGTWMATMGAGELNLFFYKSIGTKVDVFHKEQRRSGPFGWWGPLVDTWVPANADSITISNTYYGSTAREAQALGLGSCPPTPSGPRASLECKLEAFGVGVSVTYDKPLGATGDFGGLPPNPSPTPGASLEVRAVRGRGTVAIGGQYLVMHVDTGLPPWEPGGGEGALESDPPAPDADGPVLTTDTPVLNVGDRISCIRTAGESRITAVGGIQDDGTEWQLPLDAAIAAAEAGHVFYVERPAGDRVGVEIAVGGSGRQYLKTRADGDVPNNLLALPHCER
jgi:uncharacterized protein DUF3892